MTKVHYVGCDAAHDADFVFDVPGGHDCWLLLLIHTPALFWVEDEMNEYPANSAVLYPPKHKILYRACGSRYINDWMRFDTDENYLNTAALPLAVPFQVSDPEYCHRLFQLLATEFIFANDYREISNESLLRLLLIKLYESSSPVDKTHQYHLLLKLRKMIYNKPGQQWTVSMMAEQLHLSAGYLQMLYRNTFGVSCMDDVINSRIDLAKEYLLHNNSGVADIAALCGYNNVEHFCRQFRKKTGCSPARFRKNRYQEDTDKSGNRFQ